MNNSTRSILMIRPTAFRLNGQTAGNNAFQKTSGMDENDVQARAEAEFDAFTEKLKQAGVTVNIVSNRPESQTPDSLFPNNWVSFHDDGTVCLYPMFAPNRRWERRRSILELLSTSYTINNEIDFSPFEEEGLFLEGTGSLVLDRPRKIAYACLSARTHKVLLPYFEEKTGYRCVSFTATDAGGQEIYHTNVMMSVLTDMAVVCLESVRDAGEREMLIKSLREGGKEIIGISLEQAGRFAGNVLEVQGAGGKKLVAMSEQAFKAFRPEQIEVMEKYAEIVHSPLYTIEHHGGGSARCMIAEVFLPEGV